MTKHITLHDRFNRIITSKLALRLIPGLRRALAGRTFKLGSVDTFDQQPTGRVNRIGLMDIEKEKQRKLRENKP